MGSFGEANTCGIKLLTMWHSPLEQRYRRILPMAISLDAGWPGLSRALCPLDTVRYILSHDAVTWGRCSQRNLSIRQKRRANIRCDWEIHSVTLQFVTIHLHNCLGGNCQSVQLHACLGNGFCPRSQRVEHPQSVYVWQIPIGMPCNPTHVYPNSFGHHPCRRFQYR